MHLLPLPCTVPLPLATLPPQQTRWQFVCIFVALLPSHVSRSFKPHSFTLIPPSTLQKATPESTPFPPCPVWPLWPIYIMNVARASSQKPCVNATIITHNGRIGKWEKSILSISVKLNYSLCLGQRVPQFRQGNNATMIQATRYNTNPIQQIHALHSCDAIIIMRHAWPGSCWVRLGLGLGTRLSA